VHACGTEDGGRESETKFWPKVLEHAQYVLIVASKSSKSSRRKVIIALAVVVLVAADSVLKIKLRKE
jgi:hypothetical protein